MILLLALECLLLLAAALLSPSHADDSPYPLDRFGPPWNHTVLLQMLEEESDMDVLARMKNRHQRLRFLVNGNDDGDRDGHGGGGDWRQQHAGNSNNDNNNNNNNGPKRKRNKKRTGQQQPPPAPDVSKDYEYVIGSKSEEDGADDDFFDGDYARREAASKTPHSTFQVKPDNADVAEPLITYKHIGSDRFGGYVNARVVTLDNPINHFTLLPPLRGCGNVSLVSANARANGCVFATNAGFFNTRNSACLGNLVSNGTVHSFTRPCYCTCPSLTPLSIYCLRRQIRSFIGRLRRTLTLASPENRLNSTAAAAAAVITTTLRRRHRHSQHTHTLQGT